MTPEVQDPPSPRPEDIVGSILALTALLELGAITLCKIINSALDEIDQKYRKGELWTAYKRRKNWKTSDIKHLATLNICAPAKKRVQRIQGKGRPVVRPHRPLVKSALDSVNNFGPLFDLGSTSSARRKAIRHWPWWKHHV